MEVVEGSSVSSHLKRNPDDINSVFEQTILGFTYLEQKRLLHRDVRDANILVDTDGTVKIIDFGFGRDIGGSLEPTASSLLELNYWCELPHDFENNIYDYSTECYFVGKLFSN